MWPLLFCAPGALGFVPASGDQVALTAMLVAVLLRNLSSERRRLALIIVAIAVVSVGHLVHLLLR